MRIVVTFPEEPEGSEGSTARTIKTIATAYTGRVKSYDTYECVAAKMLEMTIDVPGPAGVGLSAVLIATIGSLNLYRISIRQQ